ncbi:hypothetical protein BDP27DRAFT_1522797 [Rhodocollybia butyracea]|uniref:Uncharacterized protein n=1 Tax=Rhodocollybia butyracea TaxID=206335 RepID=A0A9P5PW23_9AGAR|nr:hypothetical protein BDP27DRAFT_1522797 [Rhodocollybia butyracea]
MLTKMGANATFSLFRPFTFSLFRPLFFQPQSTVVIYLSQIFTTELSPHSPADHLVWWLCLYTWVSDFRIVYGAFSVDSVLCAASVHSLGSQYVWQQRTKKNSRRTLTRGELLRASQVARNTTVRNTPGDKHYVSYSSDGKRSIISLASSSSLKRPLPSTPEPPKKTMRRKRIYKPQGASVYMQSFDEIKADIKDAIFATDSSTLLYSPCSCGAANAFRDTRCMDCALSIPLVQPALLPIIYAAPSIGQSSLTRVALLCSQGYQRVRTCYHFRSQWSTMPFH